MLLYASVLCNFQKSGVILALGKINLIASSPNRRLGLMRTPELLEKLFEIERSVGVEDNATIREKVIEVEECVLSMQRESVELLRNVSTPTIHSAQSSSLALTSNNPQS
jgi:hypothetical protein